MVALPKRQQCKRGTCYIPARGTIQSENVTFKTLGSDKLKALHSGNRARTIYKCYIQETGLGQFENVSQETGLGQSENVIFTKQGSDNLKMLH